MNVAKMAMSTKRQCRRYKCRHKGNVDVKHVDITDVDEPAMSTLRMSPLRQCRRKNVAIVEVAITNVGEPSFYPFLQSTFAYAYSLTIKICKVSGGYFLTLN